MQDGPELVKEYVSAKRRVISGLGATLTLNENQSGSIVSLDRAAGTTVTLPVGCLPGTYFDFMVATTVTSNSDKIITGAGTELMVGGILNCDTDSSNATIVFPSLVATANLSVNLNGSTKGGLKGDNVRVTKVDSVTWQVSGQVNGTGVVATPFATS